jgi:hypothetical protein
VIENGKTVCDAGRTALVQMKPCTSDLEAAGRVHVIYARDEDTGEQAKIELCDLHFDYVNSLGLVSEPYAGRDTVRKRIGREPW